MESVVGNCGKHPGFNMINCPMCEIERKSHQCHQKEGGMMRDGIAQKRCYKEHTIIIKITLFLILIGPTGRLQKATAL